MGIDDPNLNRTDEVEEVIQPEEVDPLDLPPRKPSASAQEKMNAGASWMTIASMVSRILGVLYIMPWYKWMGEPHIANEANSLFNIGYSYYAIFLSITIAGYQIQSLNKWLIIMHEATIKQPTACSRRV